MTKAEDSMLIANCVFNAFLSFTASVLNIITILALRKPLPLPKPLKTLLLSLAVTDLAVGLLVQPMYIAILVRIEFMEHDSKNILASITYIDTANRITSRLFCTVSFLGVTAITADRFLAIQLHLRYQELVTHKRVVAVVISIWLFSGFFSLLDLWASEKITYNIILILSIVCLISTALFYFKIYAAVRRHLSEIQAIQVQQVAQNGEMIANATRLRKSAVATFYIYLALLVCYLPNLLLSVVIISGQSDISMILSIYTDTLVFFNSSLNPLIYCWKMRHIRHAVMDILRNIYPSHN